jgi:hypothetical protein
MDTFIYAMRDFFEFLFGFMPTIGAGFNIAASAVITFFTIYWIKEMFKHTEKAKH